MAQRKTSTTHRALKTAKSQAPRARRAVRPAKRPLETAVPIITPIVYDGVPSVSSKPTPRQYSLFRLLTWPLRTLWFHKWWLINLAILLAAVLATVSESVRQSTADLRFDGNSVQMQNVPKRDTALVFGAGVLPNHTPTEYLKERIETAVDLYKAHRVDSLIMSGDNSTSHYNEPAVMKEYAVKQGVKPEDIILDFAGFNSYDTCYRAKAIFGVRSATVVTQGYHLPRAIYTCQNMGIDTIGVAAKHTGRDWTVSYLVREHIATAKAMVQNQFHPQPTVLGKIEIPAGQK